jgi:predicted RNA-binding protein with RPS1 domain
VELNLDTAIAIGAAIIAVITLFSKLMDKSLSIREHDEFRRSVERDSDKKDHQRERDFDELKEQIKILQQTRPTTGELEARLKAPPQSHD